MKKIEHKLLKKYKEMCREHTTDEIKQYDYEKLKESYDEFEVAINKLLMNKRLCLYIVILGFVFLIIPQIFQFYSLLFSSVRRAGVIKYNIGRGSIIIGLCLIIAIMIYGIIANRLNGIVIELMQKQKTIDLYLFFQEIRSLDGETNARMLLFDKDDRINTYFDKAQKRSHVLLVLGIALLIVGILFAFAILILTLDSNLDNIKIVSGFLTSILIDFIGAIFIGMYNKTVESTLTLCNVMNENRKANFSFYIISKISDDKAKNKAMSKLATSMFENNK